MNYVGDFSPGATVYIYFNTFDSNDPSASVTITNFINTDVHIHKDDNLAQRNNAAGITVDVDVDAITGSHFIKIDTANNTVADFFTSGHDYFVRIEGTTVDAATINAVVGHFSLDNRMTAGKMVSTHIAVMPIQTSFTLAVGSADDDAYVGCTAIISDLASGIQKCFGIISAYTGATKTVTLAADPGIFTMAAGDNITIIAASALSNVRTVNGTLQTANDNGADINAILVDTAEIGVAGAGLTNIDLPNQTMDITGDITGNLSGSVGSLTGHTNQTGDSYGIVNHADHGNAKLVRSTTPANKLDVSATGEAGLDFDNIKDASAPKTLTNITIPVTTAVTNEVTADVTKISGDSNSANNLELDYDGTGYAKPNSTIGTTTTNTDMRGTDGANTVVPPTEAQMNARTRLTADYFDQSTDPVEILATGGTAGKNAAELIDDVWDELLTGASHNIATSAGRRLREIAGIAIRVETAQAGSSCTITLDAGASATSQIYNRNVIAIIGGTGIGQTRCIVDYNGTTKVASVDRDWYVNPDNTSEFQLIASCGDGCVNHGIAQAGTVGTITLEAGASVITDAYKDCYLYIFCGTGASQTRLISAYDSGTKIATISPNWDVTPDNTSVYHVKPFARVNTGLIEGLDATNQIRDSVVDDATRIDASTLNTLSGHDPGATIASQTDITGLANLTLADIIAGITDGALDLQEMMRIITAFAAGLSNGGGTTTHIFRDSNDSKDRITATVDADGNRTNVVLDGS